MCEFFWFDGNIAASCTDLATHEFDGQLFCAGHCSEIWNEAAWIACMTRYVLSSRTVLETTRRGNETTSLS